MASETLPRNLICASIWGTHEPSSPAGHTLSGWDDCRAWAHSIHRNVHSKVIVFTRSVHSEVVRQFHALGIETIEWQIKRDLHPSATRWEPIIDHLASNTYDRVICTDIRDVVFQSDPFDYPFPKPLILATESMPQHRCGDNYFWMQQYLGADASSMRDKEVVCGGTIAGQYSPIMALLRSMYAKLASHPNPRIIDQPVLNHLAHTEFGQVHIPRLSEGFILSGAWCWEPNILDPRPEIRKSIAYPQGSPNPFKIWHLYINRYWDEVRRHYWDKSLKKPYTMFRR